MIDLGHARLLAEDGPVHLDLHGAPGVPAASGESPALVVSEVNEAVKLVDGESLTGSLDRDGLWAVRGFLLDAAVLAALPEQVKDAADLIDLVVAAGFEWNVVSANLL